MSDERLPGWLGADADDAERPSPQRRRSLVVVLAVVPWVVLAGLLAAGAVPGSDAPAESGSQPAGAHGAHADGEETTPAATPETARDPGLLTRPDEPTDTDAGVATGPLEREVAAVALAVARAWLTDVGPHLELAGLAPVADRYLEQAAVERVDVHGDLAVVRMLAVVLERDGDAYRDVQARRLAVPLSVGDGTTRPAGAPWWLPDPDLDAHEPALEPVDDTTTALAVAEELAGHGFQDVEVLALHRGEDGWLVADVAARLEGRDREPAVIWLRDGPKGPALAGASDLSRPSPHPTPTEQDGPDDPRSPEHDPDDHDHEHPFDRDDEDQP